MFYVSLPNDSVLNMKARYKRAGLLTPSSSVLTAHSAAQFIFPVGTEYQVLNASDIVVVFSATTESSYFNSELNRSVPSWFDLVGSERREYKQY